MRQRRRRAKRGWVREMTWDQLHGLGWRLHRDFWDTQSLSARQEHLWDDIWTELLWRASHRAKQRPCTCEVCTGVATELVFGD